MVEMDRIFVDTSRRGSVRFAYSDSDALTHSNTVSVSNLKPYAFCAHKTYTLFGPAD
jgi:hypothetical protein